MGDVCLFSVDVWAILLGRYGYRNANAISRTCKLFYQATRKPQFWHGAIRDLLFVIGKENVTENVIKYFFSTRITLNPKKPLNHFEYLKCIFVANNLHITYDRTKKKNCEIRFLRHNRKKYLSFFFEFTENYEIINLMIGKYTCRNWPTNILSMEDSATYVYFPFDTNLKIANIQYCDHNFFEDYIEYYDPDTKKMYCGIGEWDDYGKLRPGKKNRGRWMDISDHEFF